MLPEVKAFLSVKNVADKVLQDWYDHARDDQPQRDWSASVEEHKEYRAKYQTWDTKYREEHKEHYGQHKETLREARRNLRASTKDPVLMWMMDNIMSHWEYIETVMQILPATREQLEEFANEHQWCEEFDGFMDEAEAAGVITALDEPWDASEIVDWIADEFEVRRREYRREIQKMVNGIVEKALADKAAEDSLVTA